MERLKITTPTGLYRIPTEFIAYIQASGNYSNLHLVNGEEVTLTFQLHHFEDAIGKLRKKSLVRIGRSLIVNKNYVLSININSQELRLMDYKLGNSFKLKVSKDALRELKTMLDQEPDEL